MTHEDEGLSPLDRAMLRFGAQHFPPKMQQRLREELTAGRTDAGDDRWSAVVSSAAQAPPAPWQVERGTDPTTSDEPYFFVGFGEKNRGGWYEHDSTLLEEGQATFIAALGNWFFAHMDDGVES